MRISSAVACRCVCKAPDSRRMLGAPMTFVYRGLGGLRPPPASQATLSSGGAEGLTAPACLELRGYREVTECITLEFITTTYILHKVLLTLATTARLACRRDPSWSSALSLKLGVGL